MSSNSYFTECFDIPKTEEQKSNELLAHKQQLEEISSLPHQPGWHSYHLYLYRGFWFHEPNLLSVLSIHRHLRPNPSDIFLASFPKSGTTWLKAIAFAICTRNPNTLLSRHPQDCSPFLEELFSGPRVPDLDVLPSPRQFHTHIPYSVLPKSIRDSPCRIVYLCREPKDTFVSTYYFVKEMRRSDAALQPISFAEAADKFCNGQSVCGPVWEHQLEYWRESRRRPHKVFFIKYEDMKENPEASVKKLAEFMGRPFSSEEEMSGLVGEIVRLTSFEKLSGLEVNKVGVRGNKLGLTVNNSSFFRKGKIGDWKEHLTVEMAERFDGITRDRLHRNGLTHDSH